MSNPSALTPSFDQVVEGNVDIKKLSKKNYKIKFSKISKILKYQTWSESSKTLNDDRSVYYQKAKTWINDFNFFNRLNKSSNKPLFTPTTVMEIGNNKYLFVIDEAKVNGKGRVVFKVSTKEIKLSEKKMLKLLCGHHDDVRFDIDSFNLADLSNMPFGSCPILIGADTIDLSQVGLFIFNVFTIQDCIAQSLNLFLNPVSYWVGLDYTAFNINNPTPIDAFNPDYGYPNSDWLPNDFGGGPSKWYECVGANQNYVAYQIQYFAMIYSYIYSVIQPDNVATIVTVPVYSCNAGEYIDDTIASKQKPVIVANLSFNTTYPLQLNTLSLQVIRNVPGPIPPPIPPLAGIYTYGYSTPQNSNAFSYGSYLSFDNINTGFGAPNTLIVPPLSLTQAFPQQSFRNGRNITYTSNSSAITIIPAGGSFLQTGMLSFVTFNSINNSDYNNVNNVSTPNPFPPGSSPQTVTITATESFGQILTQTLKLTITPNPISFLNQNGDSSSVTPGNQPGPPWNTFANGLFPTNTFNSVFGFQLQQLTIDVNVVPFNIIQQTVIANASNNYTNFFSTNMQVLASGGASNALPLQSGINDLTLVPVSSDTNQNGKWIFALNPIPNTPLMYNTTNNQATVVFTCTANGGLYFVNDASAQASNAVITNNGQIITFTLRIVVPTMGLLP